MIIHIITLCIIAIMFCVFYYTSEFFVDGSGLSILDTIQQSKQIYQIHKDRIEEEALQLESKLEDTYNSYKNLNCNKYSKFFKYNIDDNFTKDNKFYIRPKIEYGEYSIKKNACVHKDPLFKQQLDCSRRLNCANGNPVYGDLMTKDFEQVCEYNCEDIVL